MSEKVEERGFALLLFVSIVRDAVEVVNGQRLFFISGCDLVQGEEGFLFAFGE